MENKTEVLLGTKSCKFLEPVVGCLFTQCLLTSKVCPSSYVLTRPQRQPRGGEKVVTLIDCSQRCKSCTDNVIGHLREPRSSHYWSAAWSNPPSGPSTSGWLPFTWMWGADIKKKTKTLAGSFLKVRLLKVPSDPSECVYHRIAVAVICILYNSRWRNESRLYASESSSRAETMVSLCWYFVYY